MDAVRLEGTASSSLTRKRKISKLSRRIETRRQVSLFIHFDDDFLSAVSVVFPRCAHPEKTLAAL